MNTFPIFWLADEPPDREDIELWLGDESFELVPSDTTLEALANRAGVFSSNSQARKAGLRGTPPNGVEAWGTRKKAFWTIFPTGPCEHVSGLNKTSKMLPGKLGRDQDGNLVFKA